MSRREKVFTNTALRSRSASRTNSTVTVRSVSVVKKQPKPSVRLNVNLSNNESHTIEVDFNLLKDLTNRFFKENPSMVNTANLGALYGSLPPEYSIGFLPESAVLAATPVGLAKVFFKSNKSKKVGVLESFREFANFINGKTDTLSLQGTAVPGDDGKTDTFREYVINDRGLEVSKGRNNRSSAVLKPRSSKRRAENPGTSSSQNPGGPSPGPPLI